MLDDCSGEGKEEGISVDQESNCLYISKVLMYNSLVVRHLVNGALDQFLVACILRARLKY